MAGESIVGGSCPESGKRASFLASFRPVDTRYRLEAYATLTGAWSRWLPIGCVLSTSMVVPGVENPG